MRTLIFSFLSLMIFIPQAFAQMDEQDNVNPNREIAMTDEVILDNSLAYAGDWNEPIFTGNFILRDVATVDLDGNPNDVDWMGQLSVQREIPFTYPVVTRLTLQLRTLNEIEAEEARQ